MEKSKLNRFQYNERIYNYKHGLVNSAENQTEHLEHSAEGDEWAKHKYIRKEERADGTVRYIYEDGTSTERRMNPEEMREYQANRIGTAQQNNKLKGYNGTPGTVTDKRNSSLSGTPQGSYNPSTQNNLNYVPTQTNLTGGFNGTPGGSTYRKPVPGTPIGPLGNGLTTSQPRDTFKANLQMGQGGTPTGLTGTYKESDPDAVRVAANVLTAQNYKKEADKKAAERELYNGQGGTPTGLTGTTKPLSEQGYNLAAGKGTPGGVNGPAIPKNSYAADIWSALKNSIKEVYGTQTTALANQANDRMSEIAAENRLNLAQSRREEAEKAGQVVTAEQQADTARNNINSKLVNYMSSMNDAYSRALDAGLVKGKEDFVEKYIYPAERDNSIEGMTVDLLMDRKAEGGGFAKAAERIYESPQMMASLDTLTNSVANAINSAVDADIYANKTPVTEFGDQIEDWGKTANVAGVARNLNGNDANRAYANYALGYTLGYLLNADDTLVTRYPEYFAKDPSSGINHVQIDPSSGVNDIQDIYYDLYDRDDFFRDYATNMYLTTIDTPAAKIAIENVNKRRNG